VRLRFTMKFESKCVIRSLIYPDLVSINGATGLRVQKVNKQAVLVLCCALACSGISCTAFRQGYEEAELQHREASLQTMLGELRELINQYRADQGRPPRKLEELVRVGYINKVPEDPITRKADWVLDMQECAPESPCKDGIKNVHSASKEKSTRGDLYSQW